MTLDEIRTLHAYNAWATNRLFDALTPLPPDQLRQDMKGSHGGIFTTLVHMIGAEKIWLERWRGGTMNPFLKAENFGSLADLRPVWETAGRETAEWLGTMTDSTLDETFTMKTMKGDTYTHRYWQAFQHLVNHSTYHRGQVITMMRQLGVTPPATDLIVFYRESRR